MHAKCARLSFLSGCDGKQRTPRKETGYEASQSVDRAIAITVPNSIAMCYSAKYIVKTRSYEEM